MAYLIAADANTNGGGSSIWLIVIMVVMIVGMMLLTIIPQKKRQKKAQEMMNSIRVGTKVKTIGGFIGTVKAIDNANNAFVLDISANEDGSTMVTLDRSAIYTVMSPIADNAAQAETATTAAPEVVAADDAEMDVVAEEKKAEKKSKKAKKEEAATEATEEAPADNTNDLQI